MAMIRGSFQPISFELKRILKGIHEDLKKNNLLEEVEKGFNQIGVEMGQLGGYNQLQNQMQQQQQLEQRSAYLQAMMGQAQQGLGQLSGLPQHLYPGQVIHHEDLNPLAVRRFLQDPLVTKVAQAHDFEYNYDTDSFLHKNGGYVTRKMIEGTEIKYLPRIFIKAKTPNISWLDDRIEEVRIKLC